MYHYHCFHDSSPLGKTETQSTNQKLTVGLYRIKNIIAINNASLKIKHVPGRVHI